MSTVYSTLYTELDDNGIQVITLNRPDKLNALNGQLLSELHHVLEECKGSKGVRGIILTGEGKAFCAGADINRLAEANAVTGLEFAKEGQAVFRFLETLGKPSIAAVNGFAFGGGCELSMAATLRIASTKAQFGQPEVKLGVIPGYGGTQRLTRLVGKGRALQLCLTGEFIGAEQAERWGLVNQVVEPDELLKASKAMLTTINSQGPYAVKHAIEVIDKGCDMPLEEALHLEAVHFALTCGTEDKAEGTRAFLEKRKADFTGC